MLASPHPFVLSIRPVYIERILAGIKTVELRRRFPKPDGRTAVLLYSTSPVKAIVGHAVLEEVSQLSLSSLWRRFACAATVTREEFNRYFDGVDRGCALRLTQAQTLPVPLALADLARRFQFSPPQSYCYWRRPLSVFSHGKLKAAS